MKLDAAVTRREVEANRERIAELREMRTEAFAKMDAAWAQRRMWERRIADREARETQTPNPRT